jgi:biotin carboxyl carrier protein
METKIEASSREVTLSTEDRTVPGTLRLVVGGAERTIEVLEVGPTEVLLAVDGDRHRVALAASSDGTWAAAGGRARLLVEAGAKRRGGAPEEEAGAVTPAFPATVVKLLVAVGDGATKGQGLVVVSAMKTEMTLKAPYAGTVRAINCEEGQSVSPGDILVELDEGTGESDE